MRIPPSKAERKAEAFIWGGAAVLAMLTPSGGVLAVILFLISVWRYPSKTDPWDIRR